MVSGCLRGFQLCFRLRHGFIGIYSSVIQNFREVQRFLVGDHRRIEQLLQIILPAKLVIIYGDFRLSREAHIFQIRGAGLCRSCISPNLIANFAPEIGDPRCVERQTVKCRGPGRHR